MCTSTSGLGKVDVDLIGAEGRPHVHAATRSLRVGGQQRQCPGPGYQRQVCCRIDLDGKLFETVFRIQIRSEPPALGRYVIGHEIDHQLEIAADGLNIGPTAQVGVAPLESQ